MQLAHSSTCTLSVDLKKKVLSSLLFAASIPTTWPQSIIFVGTGKTREYSYEPHGYSNSQTVSLIRVVKKGPVFFFHKANKCLRKSGFLVNGGNMAQVRRQSLPVWLFACVATDVEQDTFTFLEKRFPPLLNMFNFEEHQQRLDSRPNLTVPQLCEVARRLGEHSLDELRGFLVGRRTFILATEIWLDSTPGDVGFRSNFLHTTYLADNNDNLTTLILELSPVVSTSSRGFLMPTFRTGLP